MSELKLSIENRVIDVPDLNRFRVGDHVVADACADCDRHEGVIVGIELQRLYGSEFLAPSITLLHDGYLTDGFKPMHLRKVDAESIRTTPTASELVKALRASMALIDRLMHVHVAPDECTNYVEPSRQWFSDNGGTLAALADQQAANRAALSNIGEE